jgi:hypothetical protein
MVRLRQLNLFLFMQPRIGPNHSAQYGEVSQLDAQLFHSPGECKTQKRELEQKHPPPHLCDEGKSCLRSKEQQLYPSLLQH